VRGRYPILRPFCCSGENGAKLAIVVEAEQADDAGCS